MIGRQEVLSRALTYLSVVLLHLRDDVLCTRPLRSDDVKRNPGGHWGTVPGTSWALSHTVLLPRAPGTAPVVPLLGAGHAGVVQLAFAWLTGDLGNARAQYTRDADGLTRLARDFPDVDGIGAEVHPLLPAGSAPGGCLGGAFAFAQGMAAGAPDRVVVPILGDGECETPTTTATWQAGRVLSTAAVVPIVHVNGFRMGGPSLLGRMSEGELGRYADGFGWRSHIVHGGAPGRATEEHLLFREALSDAVRQSLAGEPTAVFFRCLKGWGGPSDVNGRRILGTSHTHKTPLTEARYDGEQRLALGRWLASYEPQQLFTPDGAPTVKLADALAEAGRGLPTQPKNRTEREYALPCPAAPARKADFAESLLPVLRAHAELGDFRLFSPDELGSNRLGALRDEPWVSEVLAEEVLLQWLAGWNAAGRRGLLVSYEAFAPLLSAGLLSHLKHRRLAPDRPLPSLNLLLTSYGWQNVYTHADPSLSTSLLASTDPAVHVLVPADHGRTAAVLDEALDSSGRLNLIVAGKHATPAHPLDTLEEELQKGLAVWPHLSTPGEPELTLVVAGDLPSRTVAAALPLLRDRLAEARIRVVCVLDLTVLGDPGAWPRGLTHDELARYFGRTAPVLLMTLGHPAAVWGLLAGRLQRPVEVIGWREPGGPMPQHGISEECGMTSAGLLRAAQRLLAGREAAV